MNSEHGTKTATEVATGLATELATLGGGCFWCLEAAFVQLIGVESVVSGYAGGRMPNPDYRSVCGGDTGHAEVVEVRFDSSVIDYRTLLQAFFAIHDPTTPNRQGNDVGPQYRSGVYFEDPQHAELARDIIHTLERDGGLGAPVVTEVLPLHNYSAAEDYHQDYFTHNPHQGYCAYVVGPKVEKFRKTFAQYLK